MDGCVAAVVLSRLRAVASLGWSIATGWGLAPSGFPLLVKELMEPSPNHCRIRHELHHRCEADHPLIRPPAVLIKRLSQKIVRGNPPPDLQRRLGRGKPKHRFLGKLIVHVHRLHAIYPHPASHNIGQRHNIPTSNMFTAVVLSTWWMPDLAVHPNAMCMPHPPARHGPARHSPKHASTRMNDLLRP